MKQKTLAIDFCFHGTLIIIFLAVASLFNLNGCATDSLVSKGLLPEVEARLPPDVQQGTELILLEEPPLNSTSLIDSDGVAHIFLVDKDEQLNHIEILGDQIISHEFLDEVDYFHWWDFDAVEHPRGKLRVLAGDKQYFREASNLDWQQVEGNRCTKFVPVGNDLYCAFIINGEEVYAPKRTEVIYGIFLLIPYYFKDDVAASKLVLAQKIQNDWIVRAVLDPYTLLDAEHDFMVGTDNLGNVHFLYFTSKGDFDFIFSIFPPFFDAGRNSPRVLRYAQVPIDKLLTLSSDVENKATIEGATSKQWLHVKGDTMPSAARHYYIDFNRLNNRFAVNKVTREVSGLFFATAETFALADRRLSCENQVDHSQVEVSIHDGIWSSHCNIVATLDIPTSNRWWSFPRIKTDSKGRTFALLESFYPGRFGQFQCNMNYFYKDEVNWSAPLVLGGSKCGNCESIAVNDSGMVFVSWVNKEGKYIGRWIRTQRGDF